ncbi:hypothetical protein ELH27_14865 [Rhizobium leguminosarum]|uniref:hypothetical protein n=1 Tax=Rhizobium TaxID=379 RepID=UPI000FEC3905|nr:MULTISPECIES: hypothetical protein [Rhizobium]MBC2804805.1 hypothetical protein [Rhizobium ruizarguesonis]RWX27247.1 hypothetical protein EHH54_33865 [Rhizobium leguminosarum]TBC74057.1 hypothetical protein ELH27_14865 [Rhizobium leguminosarum]
MEDKMSTPLDDLINLAEHLERVPEPWARSMTTRLNRFVSGETGDVAAALDLKSPRGKRAWRTVSQVAARNAAIRETAAKFFPALKPTQQADELAVALRRYEASAWRADWQKETCPYKASDLHAALWLILSRVDHALSAERIRKILVTR